MTKQTPGLLLENSAWPEVAAHIEAGASAVLPVGAASKEHGRHLPMATDRLQAEWLARRLTTLAKVVVWPALTYGYYPAFVDYPGSISLSRQTFQVLSREILLGILRAGPNRVLIINTGISTIAPLEASIQSVETDAELILANVYGGPEYQATAAELAEQRRGTHADELETSIMLAIAAELVRIDLAEPWDEVVLQPPFHRDDPACPGYSPSGVYGDPTLASAEKGAVLLDAMLADILGLAFPEIVLERKGCRVSVSS